MIANALAKCLDEWSRCIEALAGPLFECPIDLGNPFRAWPRNEELVEGRLQQRKDTLPNRCRRHLRAKN